MRKSICVGLFRFDFSKSGIGVSVGGIGFRVVQRPRGNYIHMGQGGVSYKTTSPDSLGSGSPERNKQKPREQVPANDGLEEIESGSVLKMVDSSSAELLSEFNTKLRKIAFGPIAAILMTISFVSLLVIGTTVQVPWWAYPTVVIIGMGITGAAFYRDEMAKSIVLFYEMEEGAEKEYQALHNAFDKLMGCVRIFHIEAKGDTDDWKRNAGAGELVRRKAVLLKKQAPLHVKTNISVPAIPVGRQTLYFFPERLLVFENNNVGAINYELLDIDIGQTRFIEDEDVPSDSKIVDQTWKYVNKKGGPDRRFNDNRQLPILLYECIHFASKTGLNELLHASRINVAHSFKEAIGNLVKGSESTKLNSKKGHGLIPMDNDFFDFMLFWELMGENEEGFECPLCGETVKKGRELEFTSQKEKIFSCPECGGRLVFDSIDNEVRACPKDEEKPRRKTKREIEGERGEEYLRREKEKIVRAASGLSFPAGKLKSQEKFSFKNSTFYLDLTTTDFKAKDRPSAIEEIVRMFTGAGLVKDGRDFFINLLYREVLGTTGTGKGLAIPHAEVTIEDPIIIAVAISKEGVAFDSLDGSPTRIFFAFAIRKPSMGIHLKVLGRIAHFLDKAEVRAALLNSESDEETFAYLKDNLEKSWWFHK